jgi:hypothetical protein
MSDPTNVVNVAGNPDFQKAFGVETFNFLPAYGDARFYFLLPRIVTLARRRDQTLDFVLEFVDVAGGESPKATINMCLTREEDIQGAYKLLAERAPGAALIPAALTPETYWCFEGRGVHESDAFAWEDVNHARIYRRIPLDLAKLIYAALGENAALPMIRAAIGGEVAAFLPRIETSVSFDPASLLAALAGLNPGGGSVPFQRIITFFENPPDSLLTFADDDAGGLGRSRALALAGRVRQILGGPARCPEISTGPHIALRAPSGPALAQRMVWDLRKPLMATVPLLLDFDPFTPVIKQGARGEVTKFTKVPPLPGRGLTERVTIAANLPPNIVTHRIDLTLRVGVDLGPTRQELTFILYPPGCERPTAELKFRKPTPKTYDVRIRALSDTDPLETGWIKSFGDFLYVGGETLPGTSVTVRATAPLLKQAKLSVAIAENPPILANLAATLSDQEPAATFLLGSVLETARLVVTAQNLADANQILTLELPCRSASLDLPMFPQYGAQAVSVTAHFPAGVIAVDVEFQPEEGGNESNVQLMFTPAAPTAILAYSVHSIFRDRYRFRRAPADGSPDPPWSDYRSPREPLAIDAH